MSYLKRLVYISIINMQEEANKQYKMNIVVEIMLESLPCAYYMLIPPACSWQEFHDL